jgi:hypothetical protein
MRNLPGIVKYINFKAEKEKTTFKNVAVLMSRKLFLKILLDTNALTNTQK